MKTGEIVCGCLLKWDSYFVQTVPEELGALFILKFSSGHFYPVKPVYWSNKEVRMSWSRDSKEIHEEVCHSKSASFWCRFEIN